MLFMEGDTGKYRVYRTDGENGWTRNDALAAVAFPVGFSHGCAAVDVATFAAAMSANKPPG